MTPQLLVELWERWFGPGSAPAEWQPERVTQMAEHLRSV